MKFRALATKEQSYQETGNKKRNENREGSIREDNIWGNGRSKQENVRG